MGAVLRQVSPPGKTLRVDYTPDGLPHLSKGAGGWTEQPRPQQVAGTRWDGTPLLQWAATLVYAGKGTADTTGTTATLRGWGYTAGGPSPVLQVAGHGYDSVRWVVSDLEVTDVAHHDDWRPYLTTCVLTLLEFQGLTLAPTPRDSSRSSTLRAQTRVVIVSGSDSPRSVAQRFLHDSRRWTDIAKLNPPMRDPNRRFGRSRHLTLPAS